MVKKEIMKIQQYLEPSSIVGNYMKSQLKKSEKEQKVLFFSADLKCNRPPPTPHRHAASVQGSRLFHSTQAYKPEKPGSVILVLDPNHTILSFRNTWLCRVTGALCALHTQV